jgi:HAD superfamily hydrolase (TIGR01509 family)
LYLFDLDGTLIDSNGVWQEVDAAFLAHHNCEGTPEYFDYVAHAIFPTAARFTQEYYHLSLSTDDIMAEWMELAGDAYASRVPLKEGALPFLRQLHSASPRQGIALVTASVPPLCRLVLDRYELTPLFDRLIFAQELGMEKRAPRFFGTVAELLEVSPADCTLFEDAPDNCAAAKRCGMTVVGVHDPFFAASEDALRQCCDRYIESFQELLRDE